MSSQSSIDLVNRALVRIGSERISNFTANSVASQLAAEEYEPRLRARLRGVMADGSSIEWRFSMKVDSLGVPTSVRSTDPDAWIYDPWEAIYNIPADLLGIRTLRLNGHNIEFIRVGDAILCNETANVRIHYTFRQTEVNLPDEFTEAFVEDLASFFALSVKRDSGLAKEHLNAAMGLWRAARLAESKAQTPGIVKASRVVGVRFGSR